MINAGTPSRGLEHKREGTAMIKAVTFDCWNTLIVDDEQRAEKMQTYFQAIFEENKIFLSNEDISTILSDELVLFENHVACHRKTPNARGRAETIFRLAGIELPEEQLLRVAHDCDHMALDVPPPLVPGVKETLESLAESHALAVICNTGFHGATTLREILSNHGLMPYFQHMTFSDEAGVAKPHERIFHMTLQALSARPEESVHVGDSEPADISGAKLAGLRAVLFTGVNQRYAEENTAHAVVAAYADLPGVLQSLAA
jgi:HAD superfamily hydrolase (TIGR01549 family)